MRRALAMLLSLCFSAAAFAAPGDSGGSTAGNAKEQARTCNAEARKQKLKRAKRREFLRECMAGASNATVAPQSQGDKSKPALESAKP
ncbi:psiF repeat-containing protein [Noviherbaspirillum humi]|uniref:PsiF repeat-containing protein n=1 Tax=Noviherbaspirillum humi TaxID=1688639 RepID=A0A239E7Y3_9BURK|nr:PsiF family protein [Noviherbaspirillum humi]SNS40756.1 psiF repeat-containing protein [Noviherbaspirillum humi]